METTETPQNTPQQPAQASRAATPVQRPVMDVARPAPQVPPATPTPEPPKLVEMHKAPVDDDHQGQSDKTSTPPKAALHNPAHEHAAITPHGPHKPVGTIILIIMAMIILSGLAILVYLNS